MLFEIRWADGEIDRFEYDEDRTQFGSIIYVYNKDAKKIVVLNTANPNIDCITYQVSEAVE